MSVHEEEKIKVYPQRGVSKNSKRDTSSPRFRQKISVTSCAAKHMDPQANVGETVQYIPCLWFVAGETIQYIYMQKQQAPPSAAPQGGGTSRHPRGQSKAKQCNARQNKAKQGKAQDNKAKQSKAKQSKAKPS